MKTMCIGRYLIDVPSGAETSLGSTDADSIVINRIPGFAGQAAYESRLSNRESELRTAQHRTEGSLLKSVSRSPAGGSVVFVSRPDATDNFMYLIETLVNAPPVAWSVHIETIQEYIASDTDRVSRIADGLHHRSPHAIPATPGGCLPDGLLDYLPAESETYHGGAEIPSRSWSLSITTETSGPRDNVQFKDLFHRVDDAIAMAGVGSGIKKLRRAIVETDGRKGQEYIGLYPDKNGVIFDAKLELYGNATPQVPTIKLLMETGWPKKKHPDDPRTFLTEEESLAIWDAIVRSIRPRPGAF